MPNDSSETRQVVSLPTIGSGLSFADPIRPDLSTLPPDAVVRSWGLALPTDDGRMLVEVVYVIQTA